MEDSLLASDSPIPRGTGAVGPGVFVGAAAAGLSLWRHKDGRGFRCLDILADAATWRCTDNVAAAAPM